MDEQFSTVYKIATRKNAGLSLTRASPLRVLSP
jgi:hypothetical protein